MAPKLRRRSRSALSASPRFGRRCRRSSTTSHVGGLRCRSRVMVPLEGHAVGRLRAPLVHSCGHGFAIRSSDNWVEKHDDDGDAQDPGGQNPHPGVDQRTRARQQSPFHTQATTRLRHRRRARPEASSRSQVHHIQLLRRHVCPTPPARVWDFCSSKSAWLRIPSSLRSARQRDRVTLAIVRPPCPGLSPTTPPRCSRRERRPLRRPVGHAPGLHEGVVVEESCRGILRHSEIK